MKFMLLFTFYGAVEHILCEHGISIFIINYIEAVKLIQRSNESTELSQIRYGIVESEFDVTFFVDFNLTELCYAST